MAGQGPIPAKSGDTAWPAPRGVGANARSPMEFSGGSGLMAGALKMSNFPDQKQFWDAYGHALGAATGLELTMRIALVHAAAKQGQRAPEATTAVINRIRGMTLGGTAKSFMRKYPEFADDEAFVSGLNDAVIFRNHLAHNFLEGRLDAFRSDNGIKLVALECMLATEHFSELERVVRARCPADFEAFFRQGERRGDAFVNNHPLSKHLAQIKAGEVPPDRGLDWWKLEEEVTSKPETTPLAAPSSPGAREGEEA